MSTSARLLHAGADEGGQLRRPHAEPLVPPPGAHGERARPALGQLHCRLRGGVGGLGHPQRAAHPDDAGNVPHPRGHRVGRRHRVGRALDPQQDHALPLPELDSKVQIPNGAADVRVQKPLELLPVAPLQHDLAELEQHARFAPGGRAAGHELGRGSGG
jgi:hypothetical protein